MLYPGDKAPNFSLFASDKSEHHLSDKSDNHVVLLFFPLAFTSTCTEELCTVRDEISVYENLNTEIYCISVDSYATLAKFKELEGYNFTFLSDWNKEVTRSYDCLYEEYKLGMRGVSKRSAFVIDRSGIIRYAEVLENAGDIPDFNKIKETLSSLS